MEMEAEDGARTERPDPSRGGSEGYDSHYRETILQLAENGQPHRASRSSVWRWRQQIQRQEKKGGPTSKNDLSLNEVKMQDILVKECKVKQAHARRIAKKIYNIT